MSRFSNLEFGEEENRRETVVEVEDETHHLSRAEAFFWTARFEEALRAYSKVLEFNPQNTAAWSGQVRMLIELEEFHEARVWADAALKRFPDETDLLAAKAAALGRMGETADALAFSDASMETQHDSPYAWLARGDVFLARREKRAEDCFSKALALSPDWRFHWLASRIHAFYSKFALALQFSRDAVELAPGQAVLWWQMGQCQMALGLSKPARHAFAQARELDPDNRELREALDKAAYPGIAKRLWYRIRNLRS